MAQKSYDVAVLGLGTMGTFACMEIARRKASVIGFDRFAPPHDRGSHSGDTRVYREAYAEHPNYVPIAKRAGKLWERLGDEAGTVFLHRCGMLNIGTPDSSLIAGIRESATLHKLAVEEFRVSEIWERFPVFKPPPDTVGIFEPTAGWVDVNASLEFGLQQAKRLGAETRVHVPIERWERDGRQFRILTAEGTVMAERLIITAGAWAGALLSDLRLPLRVLRKVLVWVDPLTPDLFRSGSFPVFAFSDRFLYGFPNIGGKGVKFAIHLDPYAPETRVENRQPEPESSEIDPALRMVAELLPGLAGPLPGAFDRVVGAKTCLYTMTPDEHFILDQHPFMENVWIAAGFSGHGFKFAPAIGETLAELALSGMATLPIGFLGLSGRFPQPYKDC